MKVYLKHAGIEDAAVNTSKKILTDFKENRKYRVGAVPRGGVPCLYILSKHLPSKFIMEDNLENCDILIDDVIDSGTTKTKFTNMYPTAKFYAFYENPINWLVFPWEGTAEKSITDEILRICQYHNITDPIKIAHVTNRLLNKENII